MQFFGLEMGKSFLTESPVLLAFSWCILMALNVENVDMEMKVDIVEFVENEMVELNVVQIVRVMIKALRTVGRYFMLMGRTFSRPERMRMFFRQYLNELEQLGVNSIGIVLLISFFIGAVITIQIKLNIESPWMPRWTVGYVTREIMLLEFSSSIMCLILAGKVGSNIASELGTMRVTQQIDALEIMGVNSANYLILPKITAMVTVIPILVTFSIFAGIIGAFCTCWLFKIQDYRYC